MVIKSCSILYFITLATKINEYYYDKSLIFYYYYYYYTLK